MVSSQTNQTKTQTIYVMIGLPGAGKDTWIRNNLPNIPTVCRDDLRVQLGMCGANEKYAGTREEEDKVSYEFSKRLVSLVKSGSDVVINNTNLRRGYRNNYKKLLENFRNLKWVYVVVEAPSIEDNISRRNGQVPPDVIKRMLEKYTPPTPDEYDQIIHYKSNS